MAVSQNYISKIDDINNKIVEIYHSDKDSAIFFCIEMAELAKEHDDWRYQIEAYINASRIMFYYDDIDGYRKYNSLVGSIFNLPELPIDSIPDFHLLRRSYQIDKANYFYLIKQYDIAERQFRSVIRSILQKDSFSKSDVRDIRSCSIQLASMKANENKAEEAEEIYLNIIRFIKSQNPVNEKYLHSTYRQYSELLLKTKRYKEANRLLKLAFTYYRSTSNKNSINTILYRLSNNYIRTGQLDSANYYLQIMEGSLAEVDANWNQYYGLQARVAEKQGNIEEAISYLEKAGEKAKQYWEDFIHPDIPDIHLQIGDLYAKQGNAATADAYYQKAIDNAENFEAQNSFVQQSMLFKAKLKKQSLVTDPLHGDDPVACLRLAREMMPLFDAVKNDIAYEEDRFGMIENSFAFFETTLSGVARLYESSGDESYVDTAFYFMEKSKANVLRNAVQQSYARHFADLPDSLLQKEQRLKAEIQLLEEKGENKNVSPDVLERTMQQKNEYSRLIHRMEGGYKDYYDLKYNNEVMSLGQVQKQLRDREMMISYFFGRKSVYIAAMTKTDKQFIRLTNTEQLTEDLNRYSRLIKDHSSPIQEVRELGRSLYQELIPSLVNKKEVDDILILPDGILNYIPLESFSTDNLEFLVERYAISYAPSATLLSRLQSKETDQTLLSFAPSFDQPNRHNLLPINQNIKESEGIQEYFEGNTYKEETANKSNFLQNANHYSLVHLSTHARYNDSVPERSFLAFTGIEDSSSILYANEIYDLDLSNVQLMTLSACETGIGELTKGDGLISISRAFYYAGVPSITTTLWQIDDLSTASLMGEYYKNLSGADTKSRALQKAKVRFLEKNAENGLAHPYYWAAFVVHGNNEALSPAGNWIYWLTGVAGLGIIVLILALYRRNYGKGSASQ